MVPPIKLRPKFHGTMLGLACGDALGYEVEFSSVEDMKRRFGPKGITSLEQVAVDGVAYFSDDTQMSLAVAHGLVAAGPGATPESSAPHVAREFVQWSQHPVGGHRAPGGACMAGCRRLATGTPWEHGGGLNDGGCGAVMRAAPYALRWWNDPALAVEAAVRHGCMTHRHPLSLAACAAFVTAMHHALHARTWTTGWEAAIAAAEEYDHKTAGMLSVDYGVARALRASDDRVRLDSVKDALNRRQGWAGHEAICAALFCFATARSYTDAVALAANSPGDSDSIACITGALAGAYWGVEGIPSEWVQLIERRSELLWAADELHALSGSVGTLFQMEGSS